MINQKMEGSPNSRQAGRDVVINQAPNPELKTIEETSSDNKDGYILNRLVEMNAPYAGKLIFTIKASGLIKANVGEGPRQITLPDGNVMTVSGGGIFEDIMRSGDLFTTTVPNPNGRYLISVTTKSKTAVVIDSQFR